jgi:predicted component of type VI protein secretion system
VDVALTIKSKATGTEEEVRWSTDRELVLGRGPDSPVLLNGTGISREHVRFRLDGQDILVTDLSSNGTWINGERLARGQQYRVAEGDFLEVPGHEIVLSLLQSLDTGVPSPAVQDGAPPARAVEASQPQQSKNARPSVPGLALLRSLTMLERFLILVALAAIVLLLSYIRS